MSQKQRRGWGSELGAVAGAGLRRGFQDSGFEAELGCLVSYGIAGVFDKSGAVRCLGVFGAPAMI